jgi:ribonuclease HI
MYKVVIYTDGACSRNGAENAVGGYGAIIRYGQHEKIIRGRHIGTTNNRMELTAVIEAIRALTKPCDIQVITDSTYVISGAKAMRKWLAKKNLKNRDLWLQLIDIGNKGGHKIQFTHVMGHTGDVMNERCDKIAKEQIRKEVKTCTG